MEGKATKHDPVLFLIPYSLFLIALVTTLLLPSCQPGREPAQPPVRLDPEVQRLAEEVLASLENPVTIHLTLGGDGETRAEETEALVDMVARVSSKVTINKLDITNHPDTISKNASHGPIIEMKGQAPGILRYYGYPERKEFRPFLEGILSASGHQSAQLPAVKSYITGLDEEILIRIFTTPD